MQGVQQCAPVCEHWVPWIAQDGVQKGDKERCRFGVSCVRVAPVSGAWACSPEHGGAKASLYHLSAGATVDPDECACRWCKCDHRCTARVHTQCPLLLPSGCHLLDMPNHLLHFFLLCLGCEHSECRVHSLASSSKLRNLGNKTL